MDFSKAFAIAAVSVSVAVVIIVITFYGMQSLNIAHRQGTERQATCENLGGNWIQFRDGAVCVTK